jgi:alpha-D-xyloside xylohydrolase
MREGALLVAYPAEHVARGLGDVPEAERPLEVTRCGEPPIGRPGVDLADGTRVRWRDGELTVASERPHTFSPGPGPPR